MTRVGTVLDVPEKAKPIEEVQSAAPDKIKEVKPKKSAKKGDK